MPHCIIEYSKDLEKDVDPKVLVESVYQGTLNAQLFNVDDIRVRATSFEYYLIGGIKKNFIHVSLKMFAGRTDEQCEKLSSVVLSELNKINLSNTTLTVEVIDIAKNSYVYETKE